MTDAREDARTAPASGAEEEGDSDDTHLTRAYQRSVVAGEERLRRSWPNLLATGFVGGMDVGVGVLALLVVKASTGDAMLGSLAFASGFVILVLARSELFTENFLVPVTVVVTERRGLLALARLWFATLLSNWAGGALLMGLVVIALDRVERVAIDLGAFYPEMGIGLVSFASAVLGGVLITLMTWIERASREMTAKLLIAVITAFLLAAPPLNHSVVGALEMMAGLFSGSTPYGWLDALGTASWAVLGNVVGGVGLVTLLRLVQVGADAIESESR